MSRYIDAEILLDAMRHITLGETDVARSEMKIVHYICHMPHIDNVRENVRGEWILHIDDLSPVESTMECNQCHEHQPVTIDDNFCPNCGADMRGDNNEMDSMQ